MDRTPLNQQPVRGDEYECQAIQALQIAGVVVAGTDADLVHSVDEIEIGSSGVLIHDRFQNTALDFAAVVFAPNGTAPEHLSNGQWSRGVSFSAASDAPLVRGCPVVVTGCGGHALQQSCIALNYASTVTLCCEESSIRTQNHFAMALLDHARKSGRWDLRLGCRLLAASGFDGASGRVLIESDNVEAEIEASMLLLARDPVPHWGFEPDGDAKKLWDSGRIFPSGLAQSVDYMDHPALYQSGLDAAMDALSALA